MTFRRPLALASLFLLGACATTIDEGTDGAPVTVAPDSGDLIEDGVIADSDAPTATTTTTGSAADLLPELSSEMSRLGSQVADGEGDDETLAVIDRIWEQLRPEIERDRPDLLNGLGATIDMARLSVERTRPADADKAFSLLTDIVDQFTGEG